MIRLPIPLLVALLGPPAHQLTCEPAGQIRYPDTKVHTRDMRGRGENPPARAIIAGYRQRLRAEQDAGRP